MTERQQKLSTTAMFSLAVSVAGLAITIAVGIAKMGTAYGIVSAEHKQILHENHQILRQQQEMLNILLKVSERKCQ